MKSVAIGNRLVGSESPCFLVGEIGINHNGDMGIAKKLIQLAAAAGFDAVKFQKRTVDVVYSSAELSKPRKSPFGETNGDLKRGLEFSIQQYAEIDQQCRASGIGWFVSCWDERSVDDISVFDPPCYKIASACLTDDGLLRHTRGKSKAIIMSTGMSTIEQVAHAVSVLGDSNLILMHTVSTYPAEYSELNLKMIATLAERFKVPIGYSGHETGLASTVAAVAIGACCVERHITLDRTMWGSDQATSLEPAEFARLVREIREVEAALGDGVKRVLEREKPIIEKLRRVGR